MLEEHTPPTTVLPLSRKQERIRYPGGVDDRVPIDVKNVEGFLRTVSASGVYTPQKVSDTEYSFLGALRKCETRLMLIGNKWQLFNASKQFKEFLAPQG